MSLKYKIWIDYWFYFNILRRITQLIKFLQLKFNIGHQTKKDECSLGYNLHRTDEGIFYLSQKHQKFSSMQTAIRYTHTKFVFNLSSNFTGKEFKKCKWRRNMLNDGNSTFGPEELKIWTDFNIPALLGDGIVFSLPFCLWRFLDR